MKNHSICTACHWYGPNEEVLKAKHPFCDVEVVLGCPKCKSVNVLVKACDVDGCKKIGGCGTPTESGYRWTCGKHVPVPIHAKDKQ